MTPEATQAETALKVLLVDDQRIIGEAVRRMLRTQPDIEFHFCQHAEEAIAKANDIQPTLILQDLVLPEKVPEAGVIRTRAVVPFPAAGMIATIAPILARKVAGPSRSSKLERHDPVKSSPRSRFRRSYLSRESQ